MRLQKTNSMRRNLATITLFLLLGYNLLLVSITCHWEGFLISIALLRALRWRAGQLSYLSCLSTEHCQVLENGHTGLMKVIFLCALIANSSEPNISHLLRTPYICTSLPNSISSEDKCLVSDILPQKENHTPHHVMERDSEVLTWKEKS